MTPRAQSNAAICFTSAGRAEAEALAASRRALGSSPLASGLLDAIPGLALVLNVQRQIVGANQRTLETLGVASLDPILGLRPGELLTCVHAEEGPDGCGTGSHCEACGAVNAVLECIATERCGARECRLLTQRASDGGALDVRVDATMVRVGDEPLVVVALTDISSEKRRAVLERLFFHDILNTAGGILGVSELLLGRGDREAEREFARLLHRMSREMVEEIQSHQEMMAAERGELAVCPEKVSAPELLADLARLYRDHKVARGRTLHIGKASALAIVTDRVLLRRALGNLVKNALEAVPEGAVVTLGARQNPRGGADFTVHNPGAMSADVQKQIFQRSFSTKGGRGRGIGTHSVRLFVGRFLGGTVTFRSELPEGTTFTVSLPGSLLDER